METDNFIHVFVHHCAHCSLKKEFCLLFIHSKFNSIAATQYTKFIRAVIWSQERCYEAVGVVPFILFIGLIKLVIFVEKFQVTGPQQFSSFCSIEFGDMICKLLLLSANASAQVTCLFFFHISPFSTALMYGPVKYKLTCNRLCFEVSYCMTLKLQFRFNYETICLCTQYIIQSSELTCMTWTSFSGSPSILAWPWSAYRVVKKLNINQEK